VTIANHKGLFMGKLLVLLSSILMLTVGCAQPKRQSFLSETPLETQVSSPKLKQVLKADLTTA
jgi:uncharacterized lipoprotein YajG